MAKFCTNCGAKLDNGTKFCCLCGEPSEPLPNITDAMATPQKKIPVSTFKTTAMTAGRLFGGGSSAPTISGETMVCSGSFGSILGGSGKATSILGPIKVISGGIKSIKNGFKSVLKNKKKLIPAVILSVTWILLTLLPTLGINPIPIKILSFLTFAQGGMSNNVFRMFAGILGKTIFATFVFTIFGGGNPLKKLKGYLKLFTGALKTKDKLKAPATLLGVSLSMIIFNFIVVSASPWSFMAGAATIYLTLKAISGGFLKKLLTSIFAKVLKGKAVAFTTSFMAGTVMGFAISTVLGLLDMFNGRAPSVFGVLILMVSSIWLLIALIIMFVSNKAKGAIK